MSGLISVDIHKDIADVRLNRPDKYNALSREMFSDLIATGEALIDAIAVRAVVLSGNGPGFCAGLDFSSFREMESPEREPNASPQGAGLTETLNHQIGPDPENLVQRAAFVWRRLPVPVIAAIHGVAYGGGCQIALGADIRIASPDAKLSISEIKWGLIPDMGLTQTLRDLVRLDVAKELVLTGRVLEAGKALQLGLVTRVDANPLEAALSLASEIASKSPDAVRAGKALLESSWHADEKTGFELEAELQKRLIGSLNQIEAVRANFERRAPQFRDPG